MFKKIVLSIILIIGNLMLFSQAFAANFSNFYFLGDSLSDVGNNPSAPYVQSGGKNWAQLLAAKYGNTVTASGSGGNDYAYGGAETGTSSPAGPDFARGLLTQTAQFLQTNPHLDSNSLYSIWAGANDIFYGVAGGVPAAQIVQDGVVNTVTAVQMLHNAGAHYIILSDIPDLGFTPAGQAHGPVAAASATEISEVYNNSLRQAVNSLNFDVIQVDDFGALDYIVAHAQSFGFTHTYDDYCSAHGDTDCAGYLFNDTMHPTQAGYQILADYYYSVLTAVDYYAYLAETPFSITRTQNNAIDQELLQQFLLGSLNQSNVFISGDYIPNEIMASNSGRLNNKNNSGSGTIGAYYPVSDKFLFGAAYGYTRDSTELTNDVFEYNTIANTVSLFANYHLDKFYLNGIANYDYLQFDNINRTIALGNTSATVTGSASGAQFGLDLDGGYLWSIPNTVLKTGPVANATYQRVYVQDYAEGGGDDKNFLALDFANQNNDALDTGIGWQAVIDQPLANSTLTGGLSVTGDRQWISRNRMIGFNVVSLPGSHGSLPAVVMPAVYYADFGATVGLAFKNGWTTALGYNGIYGQNNLRNNSVNLNLAKAF